MLEIALSGRSIGTVRRTVIRILFHEVYRARQMDHAVNVAVAVAVCEAMAATISWPLGDLPHLCVHLARSRLGSFRQAPPKTLL